MARPRRVSRGRASPRACDHGSRVELGFGGLRAERLLLRVSRPSADVGSLAVAATAMIDRLVHTPRS